MNGEPIPDLAAEFLTKRVGQGLALVRVEIVHNQVNRRGGRVLHCYFAGEPRELKGGSIRGGRGEVVARLGLHRAENISRATSLVLVISSGLPPRHSRRRRTDVSVQRDWLFVHADHRSLADRKVARTPPARPPSWRCTRQ